ASLTSMAYRTCMSNPPFKDLPERQMLDRDMIEMHETLTRNNSAFLAREGTASVGERCLWTVVVDLTLRAKECAQGASLLLAYDLVIPFFPLLRQVYESVITLAYLSKQHDPYFEAQVAVAHEYERALWVLDKLDPPATARTSDGVIVSLQKSVDDARRKRDALNPDWNARSKAHNLRNSADWTGIPRSQVIKDLTGSTVEYYYFYARVSQLSHPHTLVGGHMRDGSEERVSGLARRTRIYLRDAWSHLVHWIPVPLANAWLDDPRNTV
ncbi:MAG: DUF5677 domain-containing protein, partial [Gemmatimonadaceae bacterium]